jgi:hypothetical protein
LVLLERSFIVAFYRNLHVCGIILSQDNLQLLNRSGMMAYFSKVSRAEAFYQSIFRFDVCLDAKSGQGPDPSVRFGFLLREELEHVFGAS